MKDEWVHELFKSHSCSASLYIHLTQHQHYSAPFTSTYSHSTSSSSERSKWVSSIWQKDPSVVRADSYPRLSGSQAVNNPPALTHFRWSQECEQANDADNEAMTWLFRQVLTRKGWAHEITPQTFKLFVLCIITIASYFPVDFKLDCGGCVSRFPGICQRRHDFITKLVTKLRLTLTCIAIHSRPWSKRCKWESKSLSQTLQVTY